MTNGTYYISIGNSDDKLTQAEWMWFWRRTNKTIRIQADTVHGSWLSPANDEWQNACWCIEATEGNAKNLRGYLANLCKEFRQDSIAWAKVSKTDFIGPTVDLG